MCMYIHIYIHIHIHIYIYMCVCVCVCAGWTLPFLDVDLYVCIVGFIGLVAGPRILYFIVLFLI